MKEDCSLLTFVDIPSFIYAYLLTRGLKKAVVTNAPRENVNFLLEVLQLADTFDAVILAEEATAGKPDPAPYQLVLDRFGISAKEAKPLQGRFAIAFEDSPSGIKSAAGAAMVISDFTEQKLRRLLDSFS
jgi:HAD superfamily hydrolase (TIGR01509 family)